MQQISDELFERIVQEVIRRLLASGVDVAESGGVETPARELAINDRVVTLETLRGRLTNVDRLIVPKKAIVTPAVKDELKDRGIEWTRVSRDA